MACHKPVPLPRRRSRSSHPDRALVGTPAIQQASSITATAAPLLTPIDRISSGILIHRGSRTTKIVRIAQPKHASPTTIAPQPIIQCGAIPPAQETGSVTASIGPSSLVSTPATPTPAITTPTTAAIPSKVSTGDVASDLFTYDPSCLSTAGDPAGHLNRVDCGAHVGGYLRCRWGMVPRRIMGRNPS